MDTLANHFREMLALIGEAPTRPGLTDTPERAAKAWTSLTNGYDQNLETIVEGALFPAGNEQMVIVKDIELYSICEHHLLPFQGRCHIGYLPQGKIIGLSKLGRITDMFSRRLQMQEKLTYQIATAVSDVLNARGVGVVIEAKHLCMMLRGSEKQNSTMVTSVMLGTFLTDTQTRMEFFQLLRMDKDGCR